MARPVPGLGEGDGPFPKPRDLHELLLFGAGFRLLCDDRVEGEPGASAARADFSQSMRDADSILTALSDAEVDAGIAALRSRSSEIERSRSASSSSAPRDESCSPAGGRYDAPGSGRDAW